MTSYIQLLLVDDDEPTRSVYAEFLKEGGFAVTEAKDGLEALEAVNQSAPDIILTGIIMPRMDGFTLVENLRKNMATARIPVVFLSHLGREEDRARAEEVKVNDFIVRDTTTPREVIARLKAQLSATAYLVAIDARRYDAQTFARDMGLQPDFLCTTGEGERFVLQLKRKDRDSRHFDAELTCV